MLLMEGTVVYMDMYRLTRWVAMVANLVLLTLIMFAYLLGDLELNGLH